MEADMIEKYSNNVHQRWDLLFQIRFKTLKKYFDNGMGIVATGRRGKKLRQVPNENLKTISISEWNSNKFVENCNSQMSDYDKLVLKEIEDMGIEFEFRCPLWKSEIDVREVEENSNDSSSSGSSTSISDSSSSHSSNRSSGDEEEILKRKKLEAIKKEEEKRRRQRRRGRYRMGKKFEHYCDVCNKTVYTAKTKKEVKEYVSKGYCFSFEPDYIPKPKVLKTNKLTEVYPTPVPYGTGRTRRDDASWMEQIESEDSEDTSYQDKNSRY